MLAADARSYYPVEAVNSQTCGFKIFPPRYSTRYLRLKGIEQPRNARYRRMNKPATSDPSPTKESIRKAFAGSIFADADGEGSKPMSKSGLI
jgi:hypothetical protein